MPFHSFGFIAYVIFFFHVYFMIDLHTLLTKEMIHLIKNQHDKPYVEDDYDDDNIPEIDLPKTTDVTPDEVRRRDGPGGE